MRSEGSSFAVTAVEEDGECNHPWTTEIENQVHGRTDGSPRVKDIVNEKDLDAMGLRQTDNFVHRLQHSCRCLRVHERNDLVAAIFERRFDARGIVCHTPFAFENGDFRVLSLRHLTDTSTEIAVDATEYAIARLQHVGDTHLHPRGPRPGRGLGQVILRLKHHAQTLPNLVEHLDISRVEMADNRGGEGTVNVRMDVERARSHQCSHGSRGPFHDHLFCSVHYLRRFN